MCKYVQLLICLHRCKVCRISILRPILTSILHSDQFKLLGRSSLHAPHSCKCSTWNVLEYPLKSPPGPCGREFDDILSLYSDFTKQILSVAKAPYPYLIHT
jgi:hypothetical protein